MSTSDPNVGHAAILPGTLVYLDTFAGLVPAKVIACHDLAHATVRLTATRGAFRRGEVIFTNARLAVPRSIVYTKSGKKVIAGLEIRAYPAPGKGYTPPDK